MKDSPLGDLYRCFATSGQADDLESRLNKGGMGWGHAKDELFTIINDTLKEPRDKYNALRKDTAKLEAVLKDGAERGYEISRPVLNRVRNAVGLKSA